MERLSNQSLDVSRCQPEVAVDTSKPRVEVDNKSGSPSLEVRLDESLKTYRYRGTLFRMEECFGVLFMAG